MTRPEIDWRDPLSKDAGCLGELLWFAHVRGCTLRVDGPMAVDTIKCYTVRVGKDNLTASAQLLIRALADAIDPQMVLTALIDSLITSLAKE